MREKFVAMQTWVEKVAQHRAGEVVKLQGQVQVLEDEVEQLERRWELRLEEGEPTKYQRCCQ